MALKTTLTTRDIDKLLEQTTNLRDRLIILFYYDTGVRASELLRLTRGNIDLEQKTVLIPHLKRGTHKICPKCGKRGGRHTAFCSKCGTNLSKVDPVGIEERSRIIDISDELASLIKEFIGDDPPEPNRPLIEMTRQNVYYIIRRLAELSGLGGKIMLNPETGKKHFIHPHNFRDSLATDGLAMAKDNANLQKALQSKLGHKDFSTTQRYNKLTPDALKEFSTALRAQRRAK